MRLLIASAITSAALVEGAILGLVIGGCISACMCRGRRAEEPLKHPARPAP